MNFQYDWALQTKKNYTGIKRLLPSLIQKLSIKSVDILICTMPWLKNIAITKYNKSASDIYLIPNFVEIDLFHPHNKKKQIVFAGRLHWSKGIKYLIEAFNTFSKDYQDYKLLILGDGEEKKRLENLSTNKTIFLGNQPREIVAKIFNESEIFVLPTVTMEGHPKALIEAMASKCICLASDAPGNKDVLMECGLKEYIFKKKSSDLIYKSLKHAINNNLSEISYSFAVSNYSFKNFIRKDLNILKNASENN